MHASNTNSDRDAGEKIEPGVERHLTLDENSKTEVVEDSGEVFKAVPGQADFRALGW